jgi:hypothetical protein
MVCVTGLAVLLLAGCAPKEEVYVEEGVAAAEAWLALVDSGDYGRTWDLASDHFQTAVRRDQWVRLLEGHAGQYSGPPERTVRRSSYRTVMDGSPVGHYVLIEFDTLAGGKPGGELVTLTGDGQGTWKVFAYYPR